MHSTTRVHSSSLYRLPMCLQLHLGLGKELAEGLTHCSSIFSWLVPLIYYPVKCLSKKAKGWQSVSHMMTSHLVNSINVISLKMLLTGVYFDLTPAIGLWLSLWPNSSHWRISMWLQNLQSSRSESFSSDMFGLHIHHVIAHSYTFVDQSNTQLIQLHYKMTLCRICMRYTGGVLVLMSHNKYLLHIQSCAS